VVFISGKMGANREPLKPSRLLFRCPDSGLVARARLLFGGIRAEGEALPFSASVRLNPAPPSDTSKERLSLKRLSVTAFRDYLACPFRFYLRHVLEMEARDDLKTEMDALDFGNLIHSAWEYLYEDERLRKSDQADALAAFLAERAEAWVRARFGRHPGLPVRVGLHTAVQRLRAGARVQARLAAEGWEMMSSETLGEITLSGVTVRGKIDRIDRHRSTGKIRIIDYKSSDRGDPPDVTHLKPARGECDDYVRVGVAGKPYRWVDLQLPLYTLLAAEALEGEAVPELAYFNLPKAVGATDVYVWDDFNEELRKSAIECAGQVAGRITRHVFWPPAEKVEHDDFEHVLGADAGATVQADASVQGLHEVTL